MQLHGSTPYAELRQLGLAPSEIIDFSASVNPLPSPLNILDSLKGVDLKNYPDRDNTELIKTISDTYGVDVENVLASAGTTEVIYSLPSLYKHPLILAPSYGDYEDAFSKKSVAIQKMIFSFLMSEGIKEAADRLDDLNWDLLIIVNPNNPTGEYLEPDEIKILLERFSEKTILIDEAYQELGEDCESALSLLKSHENLIVLRSLTKSYGLPGVRCGWLGASANICSRISNVLIPWEIGCLDKALFTKVLENKKEYHKQWQKILDQKELMLKKLKNAGIEAHSGRAPFFLLDVENASEIRMKLLKNFHLHVRDCTSFGLENYIRIMPGIEEANNKLISAILQILF